MSTEGGLNGEDAEEEVDVSDSARGRISNHERKAA